jgi:hypothetical protein
MGGDQPMNAKGVQMIDSGNTVTLTWSGKEWQAKCAVPAERLIPGYTLDIPLPAAALKPDPPSGDCRLLFAKDTFLYLPLLAVHDQQALDTLIGRHFHELGNKLPSGDKSYVPIQLLEDLYVQKPRGSGNWRTTPCKCQIAGNDRVFASLNQLAGDALSQWSNRETKAIDIFHGVVFHHSRKYWPIDRMRDHVVYDKPLPKYADPGENTPPLPGMDHFL